MKARNGLLFIVILSVPLSLYAMGALPFGASPARVGSVSLGDLTMTAVYPRIFSPNGDGKNDKVGFHFDNPEELPVTGTVYDLTGAKVADLQPTTVGDPTELLLWDGKDSGGRTVPGGIYVYQIDFQGKHATGTVAVAR